MAGSFDNKGSGSDAAGKRPTPVIEGTATDVTAEPEESAAKDTPTAAPEAEAASAPPGDDASAEGGEATNGGPPDSEPESEPAPEPKSRPRGSRGGAILSHLTAGLLGGLAGAGAIAAAWTYLPILPMNEQAEAPDLTPLESRLSKLESAPAPQDSGPALAKLTERVDALESRKPEMPPEVTELADRVTQLETSLKSMAEAAKDGGSVADAAAVSQQINEAETRLDAKIDAALAEAKTADAESIAALKKEVAGIEAKLKALTEAELDSGDAARLAPEITALEERLGRIESTLPPLLDAVDKEAAETRAATLAIAFANLRAAVAEGRPYAAELATLASLSPGDGDLGALLDYEDEGIPTLRQLTQSFKAARDGALTAQAPQAESSLLNRLMTSAESLVKVRRIDGDAEGDAPDAILARAEAQLEQGDLAASMAEVEKLPEPERAAFATWLDQARARLDAQRTLQRLQNILLVSLSGNTSGGGVNTQEQEQE